MLSVPLAYEIPDYVHLTFVVVFPTKDYFVGHGDRSQQKLLEIVEEVQLLV